MPLRSVPDEAAVGEALGTLAVLVAVMRTKCERHAELFRDDLRDLGEEPLPHLGAAVIEMDRAVGIDVHQRAGLVQRDQRERDAEHHRRQRDAALEDRARRVEGARCGRGARDSRSTLELLDHRRLRLEVLDRLAVGRAVEAGAQEIGLAHVERIEAALARDRVHHPLDRDHALRAAETAEGGVRDGVGLQPPRADARRRAASSRCRRGTSRGRRRPATGRPSSRSAR